MIWTRRVALNGAQLDEVNSSIVIRGIETGAGKDTITAVSTGAPFGQRITAARRETLDVAVKFAIDIKQRNLQGRSEVLEAVNAWAAAAGIERGGAWLTAGHRGERRIRVVLAQPAAEGDLWKWTDDFQILFRAYGVPYWEGESKSISTDSATGASGAAAIGGSAVTQINAYLQNTSGAMISQATITAAGKSMSFSQIDLGASETLVIDHAEDGTLRLRIRNTGGSYRSIMNRRSPESADDLTAYPGTQVFSFNAQRACKLTVEWRDRYL